MSLHRLAIRQAVVAMLLNRTRAGANVRGSRVLAPWEDEFPALGVHTQREVDDLRTETPRSYTRRVEVDIEAVVTNPLTYDQLGRAGGERAAAELDALLEEVDALLHRHIAFEGVQVRGEELLVDVPETRPLRTEHDFEAEGVRILGGARRVWQVAYVVTEPEREEGEEAPLLSVNVDWNLHPLDAYLDATDTVAVPPT